MKKHHMKARNISKYNGKLVTIEAESIVNTRYIIFVESCKQRAIRRNLIFGNQLPIRSIARRNITGSAKNM